MEREIYEKKVVDKKVKDYTNIAWDAAKRHEKELMKKATAKALEKSKTNHDQMVQQGRNLAVKQLQKELNELIEMQFFLKDYPVEYLKVTKLARDAVSTDKSRNAVNIEKEASGLVENWETEIVKQAKSHAQKEAETVKKNLVKHFNDEYTKAEAQKKNEANPWEQGLVL